MSRPKRFLLTLALATTALTLHAATITTGQPATTAPGHADLPILFQPGPGQVVSGLQFEITFDPALLTIEDIAPGPSATTAGKMVSFNRLTKGRCRVIVAGFNQNTLPQGPLATLRIKYKGPSLNINLENPILSDPKGQAIKGTATGIQLNAVGAPIPPPPAARPACACTPQPTPNHHGDTLLFILLLSLLLAPHRNPTDNERLP